MNKTLDVLLELKESAAYWSEYDVPIGIHERIDQAIADYEAPQKHKAMTEDDISKGHQSCLDITRIAFKQGVKFAEQHHKIGYHNEK